MGKSWKIDLKKLDMGTDENIWKNNGKIVMNQLSIIYKWEIFQHLQKMDGDGLVYLVVN